ncbi:UDP-N-acetylmuramyl pentapeptide phosphotransferase/UDP-N-acetylglucosamine-1-phosphate transferase [Nitrosomonas cryotolerans]|uniref:UDP-N-acetylmuramyl pentapeptide phosphotransferase/UDP-N-acetylglucosamine-1-phosphate transferase n=1 Tax=Nitrosomonas cryotolerans ATCC 49181 TaxID=1131553 RepID=A0A1N6I713_9PROT|nr:UDP-N-acetylmuramyl pentapeptide phosphotransferase/UDP-N-acetylglucosamine-1-phosphate transferase [Nitrosomonas cryotolerans]SIO27807.1 UDP-N-acetylmuramyl pentapeptide phosphotransferase/UDP-N-acetylglucosamine-1-phosphate transferase [Nitrosomonas cryotolerans ATCC 49181]
MVLEFSLSVVSAPLLSFVVAFFSILWLIKGKALRVLDYPNSRSLHAVPVPRIGGIGLMCGVLTAWILFSAVLPVSVWVGISLLLVISLIDDIWSLPIWCRLLIHSLAAAGFSTMLLLDMYGWVAVFLTSIVIVWMSNLYNFMDGSDGLAGGMTVIGFGYYGLFALFSGHNEFAMINFSIAAAAMAFLLYNFYPARIFMGDVGAIPLGFLAAVLGILGWIDGLWSLWLPLLIFSPFIMDSTVTLIKRGLRGKKIWQAHCEHYYQRVLRSGLGHRNTALLSYILMLAVGASAMWAAYQDSSVQYWISVIWSGIYLTLMLVSDRYQRHYSSKE